MRLIPNFAELLHEIKLPSPEKCFLIENGDENYISEWIKNGELSCELEHLFEWLNTKYKLKKKFLNPEERELAEEVRKRFPIEKWRVIKIFSTQQRKYRYYKKTIEDVKSRTTPSMNEQAITSYPRPFRSIYT